MTTGQTALVTSLNRIFMYTGTGWFKIADMTNESPTAITGVDGTYALEKDGTATIITAVSSDPEGFALTWSYAVTTGSLGSTATVSQADNVFTITPSSTAADAGEFSITFSVTDGATGAVNAVSAFTLAFTKAWTTTTQEAQLSPSDGVANNKFGTSTDISDDGLVAVVGSRYSAPNGAVYFYTRSGSTWTQQHKVSSSSYGDYARGGSLALSGNGLYMVVGGASTVWVYYYNGSTWALQQTITLAGTSGGQFGYAVSISQNGDTIAAGSPSSSASSTQSQVNIWTRSGTTWTNQVSNMNMTYGSSGVSVDANDSYYGNSVSLSNDGNDLIVSQSRKYIGGLRWAGMAYFYSRSGSTWSFSRTVQNTDATDSYGATIAQHTFFGENVRMSGDGNTAIVVSRSFGSAGAMAGYAYVWVKSGGSWSYQTTIVPSDAATNDYGGGVQTESNRGVGISNDGNIIAYGSGNNDGSVADGGAVYVFTRDGSTWTQQDSKFYSTGIGSGDGFGNSVDISGDGNYIIAGSEGNDTGSSNRGSAYIIV
jgi:hypothetical protein